MSEGTVLRSRGGVYRVALEDGRRVDASIRGRLKLEERTGDRVVIGDRVRVHDSGDGAWTIEEVLPREREIVRRKPGGRDPKVVAANVDRLVAVFAAAQPDPARKQVDRLLVVAEANGIEAVLVLNKLDLEEAPKRAEALRDLYGGIGYPVLLTSAATGRGVDELRELLCRGTAALAGPSGGGKSSLLNAVQPDLDLRTGELTRKPRRGRHTTVSARLIELECGGRVADTPGFGDAGLWGVDPGELDACFPEFLPHLGECRFRGCTHLHEPDCAVVAAVEDGAVSEERYAAYRELRQEAEEMAAPRWK